MLDGLVSAAARQLLPIAATINLISLRLGDNLCAEHSCHSGLGGNPRLYAGARMHWNLVLFTALWWAFIGTILSAAMSLGVTLRVTRAAWVRRTWRGWLQGLVLILLVFGAKIQPVPHWSTTHAASELPVQLQRPAGRLRARRLGRRVAWRSSADAWKNALVLRRD